ncbi:serine/threonine protein kinase [archaeon CG10_big_fil_rev_8_21_14_0_10_43_11]|nr:MAG: serine/threonine protein kinase [archaeon CG10_big_fil_rev_8_21_14_0_10_43_11]
MRQDKLKTYQNVFDKTTLTSLYKLSDGGYLKELFGRIAEGKESHVFYATNQRDEPVVVKIFLVEASDFKTMNKYIKGDPRFQGLKRKKRTLVHAWAKKEYQNMLRARDAGIHVPTPYAIKNNVLIMEFIGKKGFASPLAKNSVPKKKQDWKECIEHMINALWNDAKLVHADLSEYNILNHNGEPVFIDWSSGVLVQHPLAKEFLAKDIKNMFAWLKSIGAKPTSEEEFFKHVIGNV